MTPTKPRKARGKSNALKFREDEEKAKAYREKGITNVIRYNHVPCGKIGEFYRTKEDIICR